MGFMLTTNVAFDIIPSVQKITRLLARVSVAVPLYGMGKVLHEVKELHLAIVCTCVSVSVTGNIFY
jgi:hypothetical protein